MAAPKLAASTAGSEHPTTRRQVERDPANQAEHDGDGRGRLASDGVGESTTGEEAEGADTAEEDQQEPGGSRVPLQVVDHPLEDEVEGG